MSAVPNAAQAEFWGGEQGRHWVAEQDRHDRMLDPYNDVIVAAAVRSTTDRILDIGCGNGSTSRALARAVPDGRVLGVDLSEPMIERAREMAAADGLRNVDYAPGDAQTHSFDTAGFDGATSRFGVMFFEDPVAAFTNIARALRPSGRLAFVSWRPVLENEWVAVPVGAFASHLPRPDPPGPDDPGAFSFGDRERVARILDEAGFSEISLEPIDLPARVGDDVADAVWWFQRTGFGRDFVEGADEEALEAALSELAAALEPYARDDGVVLGAAAWLVTARESG